MVLEVEFVIEFIFSGGLYLFGLDDNFFVDWIVFFVVIYIVLFDVDGKIF